jgi:hypothetical protein
MYICYLALREEASKKVTKRALYYDNARATKIHRGPRKKKITNSSIGIFFFITTFIPTPTEESSLQHPMLQKSTRCPQ